MISSQGVDLFMTSCGIKLDESGICTYERERVNQLCVYIWTHE